ncbi:MAG: hypothetical protein EAX89_15230 [Candidatus Lokiarchaeota archaeon]|nr:hypothetical protein [Candidatus Lokiarchaeota archaeon]
MSQVYEEFQNEKKIIQVLSKYQDIRPKIKNHNLNAINVFENQIKNAIFQAEVRGKKISDEEYYGLVKDFWKKYYIYEI